MPPKGAKMAPKKGAMKKMGKGKGKGKGKAAKAKAKAKLAKLEGAENGHDQENGEQIMALPQKEPKEKSLAGPLRKKVQDMLKTKNVEEALADTKLELDAMNQRIEEAAQIEEEHAETVKAAKHAFEASKAQVEKAMEEEMSAVTDLKTANDKKANSGNTTQAKRAELMEAQKKCTMLEVMATAFKSRQMAEDAKKKAKLSMDAAKAAMQEQREREKAALEATKKALQEAKQKRLSAAKEVSAPKRQVVAKDGHDID